MILSAILLAISCDLHTLRMIEPPPVAPYLVDSSAIPYPNRSDGFLRLTGDHLGAFYGTLNGLLQRRFFPFWSESLPENYAALSASDLPTYDFSPKNYETRTFLWEHYAWQRLGAYFDPAKRDFSGDGIRVWRGAEILKNVLSGNRVGLTSTYFDYANVVPQYWLAVVPGRVNLDATSTSGADEYIAGFVVNDLSAHKTIKSGESPLFLGDLPFRPLLGDASPFSYGGYKELLEEDTGLLPKWAAKAVEYKGLPSLEKTLSSVSSAGRSPDGSHRGSIYGSAADFFLGDDAWANLDMADISKTVSPRVWWGQFALANFVLSLLKVQFLGMKQADWHAQMSKDRVAKEKWYSCPSVRYSRQRFSGSYSDTLYATVPGIVYTGFTPGAGHTFTFDWEAITAATETVTPTESSSVSFDSPQNCKYLTAGWRDNEGFLYYDINTFTSVVYPDSLYQDPYDAQPDDPFAADPESVVGKQWAIEGRSFDPDTGVIELWIVPGYVDGEKDPNARFSDGETEKLWKRMRLRSSENLEVGGYLNRFRKLGFAGYVPAGRHAFTGPTYREAGDQGVTQPDDKSL